MYRETDLILDLGVGFAITHAFLMVNLAGDSYHIGMDFFSQYEVGVDLKAGRIYQMVCEGKWVDYQAVNLV